MAELRFSQLSPAWRRMIETMSVLQFGAIEDLVVRAGEPVLDPPPNLIQEVLFSDSSTELRDFARPTDFGLRKQVVQLIATLKAFDSGTIDRLDIRFGLPHRIRVRNRAIDGRRP